jgi:Tol biopolymer transport system component
MGTVRLALEGAFDGGTELAVAPAAATSQRTAWIACGAAVLVAAALAVPATRHLTEVAPSAPPVRRTEIATALSDGPRTFALSPDGSQLVYVALDSGVSRLWVRSLETAAVRPLEATEGAGAPFWSPDGDAVGFFANGVLKRVGVESGGARTLTSALAPRGGSWNQDGVILFTPNNLSPLFRVAATGGEPEAVTELDRQTTHRWPQFLPDGRQFIFFAMGGVAETTGIYLGALDSDQVTRLTEADAAGAYLPPGWLLWVRDGALVAQPLDLDARALVGGMVTVADGFGAGVADSIEVSASTTGMVAYRTAGEGRSQLTWFDRAGRQAGVLGPAEAGLGLPAIGPDGRTAVRRSVQGNEDIWVLDGVRASRITFDPARDGWVVWSPDGQRVVFRSTRAGRRDLYIKRTDGVGAETLLVEPPQDRTTNDWTADGRFLLYHSLESNFDLWALPMVGAQTPTRLLQTPFNERQGSVSPNGRWMVYMSDESGQMEIYVRPFAPDDLSAASSESTARQFQISTSGGIYPRWRAGGRELYYIGPEGQMIAAPIDLNGEDPRRGVPVELFSTRIVGGGVDRAQGRQYDVARDGRFLINAVIDEATPITLLQNWRPGTEP